MEAKTPGDARARFQGNVTSVTEKPTPENEQDGQAICERFVNWLNRSATLYGKPVAGSEEEVDWLAPALQQDGENLLMQVVRAESEVFSATTEPQPLFHCLAVTAGCTRCGEAALGAPC